MSKKPTKEKVFQETLAEFRKKHMPVLEDNLQKLISVRDTAESPDSIVKACAEINKLLGGRAVDKIDKKAKDKKEKKASFSKSEEEAIDKKVEQVLNGLETTGISTKTLP